MRARVEKRSVLGWKKSHARKRLFLLGLVNASYKDTGVTNMELSRERIMKSNPRKDIGKNGILKLCKLNEFEMQQVSSVLESLT